MNLAYPRRYIAWDLETDGFNAALGNHILEIGAALVVDGEITERKSWLLNNDVQIPAHITAINTITKELLDAEGIDPKEALNEFFKFFVVGTPHLTHNGIRFDIPFLVEYATRIYGLTPEKKQDLSTRLYATAIDTAVIVKGRKLEMDRNWNETFKEYADRVMDVRAVGVKYNVALCCEELEIDTSGIQMHRALGDVELTHKIFQLLKV